MKMLNNLFRIVQHKMYGTVAAMFLMVATCSFFACSKDDETTSFVSPYAENRTVMVYMAAENSLSSNAITDVREMLEGMRNDTLPESDRLVIFLDDTSMPRIYVVDKNTQAVTLSELKPVLQYDEDVNSSSAKQLGAFVDYVKANYPAESYGLLLWSHASGWLPSNFIGDQHQDASSRRRSFGVDNQRNSASKYAEGHQINLLFLALKSYPDYPPIDTQKIVYLSEDNLRAKIIFESITRLFYPTKRFSDNQLTQCSDL